VKPCNEDDERGFDLEQPTIPSATVVAMHVRCHLWREIVRGTTTKPGLCDYLHRLVGQMDLDPSRRT
jgi:hypothetical protein